MTSLSKETVSKLLLVQELLKHMYEVSDKNHDKHENEWKKPQEVEEAYTTLYNIAYAKGTMDAVQHISMFINELVDKEIVKREKKHKGKFMDIIPNGKKEQTKQVDADDISDKEKAEILYALAKEFGFIDKEEE